MTQAQRDGISSPVEGLLIYQTDGTPGYYYYTGTNWIGITSSASTSLIDCDGNIYHTIAIGDQLWMAENLKVTHYRNGDSIPNVTDGTTWDTLITDAYCWYNNDQATNEKYGALYNWYAVDDANGLCPEGWHVPTHAEWTALTTYLGGTSVAGGKMKAASDLWNSPNTDATNSSSFSGLPGGGRYGSGYFADVGGYGYWWSSTGYSSNDALFRFLSYGVGYVNEDYGNKLYGYSVRCLR
ncbi:MAG: hypothetical protein GY712_07965, partial [Oceanicoccus sp.]|nr:hypothetical protein [Oceanicoccus sp.]